MKQPMRRSLAAVISVLAAYVIGGFWFWAAVDTRLSFVLDAMYDSAPRQLAYFSSAAWLGTPSILVAAGLYTKLAHPRRRESEYLHCLKCGYILKGLSEPRCPECGERI